MAIYSSVIKIRKLITLLLTLFLISTIISFTASTFIGLYKASLSLLETGGEDDLIIYSANSRTPQTSIIPLTIYDKLGSLRGVKSITPEVVAPALIIDRALIVRGIDPSSFYNIYDLHVIEGSLISANDTYMAMIGRRIAELMKVRIGDKLLLRSIMTDQYIEVKIKGIYESNSYLDDELLVPLYVAQWLRGLPNHMISLIRLKIDSKILTEEALALYLSAGKSLEQKTTPEKRSPLIEILTPPRVESYVFEYAVKDPEESMRNFLEREIRVDEATAWSLIALVAGGAVLAIYLASSLMVYGSAREIAIVRSLGASRRKIYLWIISVVGSFSILLSALGFLAGESISRLFSKEGLILIGPYIVRPVFTLENFIATISIVTISTLVSIGINMDNLLTTSRAETR